MHEENLAQYEEGMRMVQASAAENSGQGETC